MVQRQSLQTPLHVAELERAYRGTGEPVARRQWPIPWLLARGAPTAEAVAVKELLDTFLFTRARR